MYRIRPKSVFGFLFGCLLIIVMTWMNFKFNLTPQKTFLYAFLSLFLMGVFLSSSLFERLIDLIFDSFGDEKKKEKFQSQLKKLTDSEEKKKLILKWSKKIEFDLYDLRGLIKYNGIEDDEFWISFYLSNVKEIPNNNRDYFYGFLVQLKSKKSQERLKNILVKRGILNEDKTAELWEVLKIKNSSK